MSNLESISPTKPLAPYLGGKSQLSKIINKAINNIAHTTYAEPFVGMGGVFLRRNHKPKSEVINDIDRELITLFRIIQRHYPQFMDMMKYQIASRAEFERLRRTDPNTLTDLERAARFLYLQRLCFGGKIRGRNFGVSVGRPARFDILKLSEMLDEVHTRLSSVVIECLPYQEFIKRYDRPTTLFYLDPPYWNCENDYGKNIFCREDFTNLQNLLAHISGKFIMSLNDLPEVRDCFNGFFMKEVKTTYSISSSQQKASELLISNCEIDLSAK